MPLLAVAGRLASITREAASLRRTNELLEWLCGKELSAQISSASNATTLFRESHPRQAGQWFPDAADVRARQQYAEVVVDTQKRDDWVYSVRLPGRVKYLATLDQAVQQVLMGESADRVLETAVKEWNQITEGLGAETQRAAYLRSLGLGS